MIHCENCRFWGTDREREFDEEYRTCGRFAMADGIQTGDPRAHLSDGSDYAASLVPRKDFGCVAGEVWDGHRAV